MDKNKTGTHVTLLNTVFQTTSSGIKWKGITLEKLEVFNMEISKFYTPNPLPLDFQSC